MKLKNEPIKSLGEHYNEVLTNTLIDLGVPKTHWADAVHWNIVRRMVSRKINPDVVGRPVPIKTNKGSANKEGLRLLIPENSPFRNTYPKKIKTHKDKYKYLCNLKENKEISQEIFEDLSGVLRI